MKGKKLRVLVSVYDKTGLTEFVSQLQKIVPLDIVSTGGTATYLRKMGFSVINVSDVTLFPEILDGRVKTLHPAISGAILADKHNSKHLQELKKHVITPIDIVVCNLYPFEETIEKKGVTLSQAVEQIDIGGVTLLRASAKNFQSVIILSSSKQYASFLHAFAKTKELSFRERKKLARKAFIQTSYYDRLIGLYLSK